jgi:YbbR domain-containing protein
MMKFFRNLFLSFIKNIGSIIISVVSAAIIWFAISLQIFPDITDHVTDIPVAVRPTALMTDQHLYIVGEDYPQAVTVQVEGKRYDVGQLTVNDFDAHLDLSGVKEQGVATVDIVVTPLTDDCTVISPQQTATILIGQTEEKTLTLTADVSQIHTEGGMSIDTDNTVVSPATINITGDKSVVDTIASAQVRASEDNLSTTALVSGSLVLRNKDGVVIESPDVQISASSFSVQVALRRIASLELTYSITGAPSNFDLNGLADKISIRPKSLNIASPDLSVDNQTSLNIGELPLSELTFEYLLNGIKEPISNHLPEGYSNVSNVNTAMITFEGVEDYTRMSFTVDKSNIYLNNRPAQYNCTIMTDQVTVDVIGPSDFVQSMSADDINITVNLLGSEITEGTKSINASCRIRGGNNVPAWVAGTTAVDISFALKEN